ncbi:UNVERIFIED_CONTAM: hypothetical protein K2H54_052290 [Gekko kuhli]
MLKDTEYVLKERGGGLGQQQQVVSKASGDAPEPVLVPPPATTTSLPGLLLFPSPAASCPTAVGWLERSSNGCSYWDINWDRIRFDNWVLHYRSSLMLSYDYLPYAKFTLLL